MSSTLQPTFTGIADDGTETRYADGKRWLWVLGTAWSSAVPLAAALIYFALGGPVWAVFLPLIHTYLFIPVLDALVGEDWHNPPEEVVPAMTADRFYTLVAYAAVPVAYLNLIGGAWFVATQGLPVWAIAAMTVGLGLQNGQAIVLAHELGHRTDRLSRLMAKVALGAVGYGHFCAEHNAGHHVHVATPEDCASARMGESVYAFGTRELPGALRGGWALERRRLAAKGHGFWSLRNEVLQSYAITLGVAAALTAWLGLIVLPFILVHHAFAWFALTIVNYIEHYGLLRQKKPNGRYEKTQPRHSWNTNHIVSNILTIHLQRHSDHHANPMRPYQALRTFEGIPRLPSGYPGTMGLALIPPLWRRVMDPKVMAWAGGDLSKVHVHEPARGRLEARWA